MYLAEVSSISTLPFTAAGGGSLPLAIIAAMSLRPLSEPMGLLCSRTSLSPL